MHSISLDKVEEIVHTALIQLQHSIHHVKINEKLTEVRASLSSIVLDVLAKACIGKENFNYVCDLQKF